MKQTNRFVPPRTRKSLPTRSAADGPPLVMCAVLTHPSLGGRSLAWQPG